MPRLEGPDGSGGPHVFVADIENPWLPEADQHHFSKALRLRPGDGFTASDGRGAWRDCAFGDTGNSAEAVSEIRRVAEPKWPLTVGFSLVKGAKPELVVQKLTEVGIDNIVLLTSERSVVVWDADKATRNLDRLRRVAREAAMQSRRVRLPELSGVSSVLEMTADSQGGCGDAIVLGEPGGRPARLDDRVVLVGPEGGWSPAELGSGPESISLSPQVLRAETAAIVAGSLIAQLRAELVVPSEPTVDHAVR